MKDLVNSLGLSPQGREVFAHMSSTGSISAREALLDYGISSATLARRVCDIEERGIAVTRERKKHPTTGRTYTRYSLAA